MGPLPKSLPASKASCLLPRYAIRGRTKTLVLVVQQFLELFPRHKHLLVYNSKVTVLSLTQAVKVATSIIVTGDVGTYLRDYSHNCDYIIFSNNCYFHHVLLRIPVLGGYVSFFLSFSVFLSFFLSFFISSFNCSVAKITETPINLFLHDLSSS